MTAKPRTFFKCIIFIILVVQYIPLNYKYIIRWRIFQEIHWYIIKTGLIIRGYYKVSMQINPVTEPNQYYIVPNNSPDIIPFNY